MKYEIRDEEVMKVQYSKVSREDLQQDIDRLSATIISINEDIALIDDLNATLPEKAVK